MTARTPRGAPPPPTEGETRTQQAAWGEVVHGEPRWPATLAVLIILALYWALPDRYTPGPASLTWVVPLIELALVVPLSLAAPRRRPDEPRWQRWAAIALIGVVNLANVASLVLLVQALVHGGGKVHGRSLGGPELLLSAVDIWATNVLVFALWYWELDRGGPDDRSRPKHRQPDFLFPQMSTPDCTYPHWAPTFADYLYVSFTNATAFSPTDTMPLTPWAKMLMMVQSMASLLTIALVAARAVNILN